MADITADQLRQVLRYDPETGVFRWRVRSSRRTFAGDVAGSYGTRRYPCLGYLGKTYSIHRLAWLYVYGSWPPATIDHINGNAHDNRISNLRAATSSQNCANRRPRTTSKSGIKGVGFHKNAWIATIEVNGKPNYLGRFQCLGKAVCAYRTAAKFTYGEFVLGGAK